VKFAIFGTGGVGGYFGGRLAQAGHDVGFIARGEHLSRMQEMGLRVDSINGDFVINPVRASASPEPMGRVDCVIVATKSWQIPESIEQMKSLIDDKTIVLPLLNGIEHIDLLNDAFQGHVLGGLCRISSFRSGPGHISHVRLEPFIAFGELDRSKSSRVDELHSIFQKLTGVTVDIPSDINVAMWDKFIFICTTSSIGAVTRHPFGVFRSIPESRAILRMAVEEACSIAVAKNVSLEQDHADQIMKRIDSMPEAMIASMQKDIMEGNPSELEAQPGAITRLGRILHVPTPTFDFLYASLLPMERKARGI